jgi:hypothetical protein
LRMLQHPYVDGCFMAAVIRAGKGKWLHDCGDVTTKYRNGQQEWIIRDAALPDFVLRLEAVPLAEGPGMALRATPQSAQPGDRLIWVFGGMILQPAEVLSNINWAWDAMGHPDVLQRGFVAGACRRNLVQIVGDHVVLQSPHDAAPAMRPRHTVVGHVSCGQTAVADASAWQDPVGLPSASPKDLPLACGTVDLAENREIAWAFATGVDNEPALIGRTDQPAVAFDAGRRRCESVAQQVVVDTPDARFDAAVAASCNVIDAVWYPPVFVHGTMQYNMPFLGWRTLFGGIAYGWHDRVKEQAGFYIGHQVKESIKQLPKADPKLGYGQEAPDSRFFGRGRIAIDQAFYDMQSQFFDQVLHDWRYTADPKLEKLLRPALELHLEWMRDCFDPDGDGVYESYINTWPTDSQWYNGGGTAEETAYAYRGHKVALAMAERAGDQKAVAFHQSQLAKIHNGFFKNLWIDSKGYVGAYREQLGHRRLHEDSWLYSIFLPIDAELLTPLQAAQSLYYTQWGLENERMPFGGRRVWTSNWVPSIWSIREMWPGDNYHLALAYFQTGLADDGWDVLRGTFCESMCAGPVPANLGHRVGGIDFNDCSSMFCRAVVEGVFGYRPDYPNGMVRLAPQLPADWDHASIRTPDCSLRFRRSPNMLRCDVRLQRPAAMDVRLLIVAHRVTSVQVNGQPVTWTAMPGFGQSIVRLTLPTSKTAHIELSFAEPLAPSLTTTLDADAGQQIEWKPQPGRLMAIEDPQEVLASAVLQDGRITGRVNQSAGHHMVFGRVRVGELEQWQMLRLNVTDREAEAAAAARRVDAIPKGVRWDCLDISKAFNGDIRTIFQQQYLSPRPPTCSVRIGSDGYAPWTFYYWGYKTPTIGLEQVAKFMAEAPPAGTTSSPGRSGRMTLPQGVPFYWAGENRNVAFTSLWDNWPSLVSIPVRKQGDTVWFLVCGSSNPMQCRIANAELRMRYADGLVEKLELVHPINYWTLCPIAASPTGPGQPSREDYSYARDGFCLPKRPPDTVSLGQNCRANLLSWRLRPGVSLESVTLETLSQEVVVGLMGVTLMNLR